jgi:hypothetical protein
MLLAISPPSTDYGNLVLDSEEWLPAARPRTNRKTRNITLRGTQNQTEYLGRDARLNYPLNREQHRTALFPLCTRR